MGSEYRMSNEFICTCSDDGKAGADLVERVRKKFSARFKDEYKNRVEDDYALLTNVLHDFERYWYAVQYGADMWFGVTVKFYPSDSYVENMKEDGSKHVILDDHPSFTVQCDEWVHGVFRCWELLQEHIKQLREEE